MFINIVLKLNSETIPKLIQNNIGSFLKEDIAKVLTENQSDNTYFFFPLNKSNLDFFVGGHVAKIDRLRESQREQHWDGFHSMIAKLQSSTAGGNTDGEFELYLSNVDTTDNNESYTQLVRVLPADSKSIEFDVEKFTRVDLDIADYFIGVIYDAPEPVIKSNEESKDSTPETAASKIEKTDEKAAAKAVDTAPAADPVNPAEAISTDADKAKSNDVFAESDQKSNKNPNKKS